MVHRKRLSQRLLQQGGGGGPVTFEATANTWLDANLTNKDNSQAGSLFLKSFLERRVLLRFNLLAIPAGAVVSAARLEMHKGDWLGTDPGGRTYRVQRLTRVTWKEGDGLDPSLDGTTWTNANVATATAWTAPGGDVTATDQVDGIVPTGRGVQMVWNGMENLVAWARANGGQLDLLIRDTLTATNHQSIFAARTDGLAILRPRLLISFA